MMSAFSNGGKVWVGTKADGFFVLTPEQARDLARVLLIEADEAEGERPAHVYQVQAYTIG